MNIIKKIQKKQKRKKLMRQKARLAQEQAAQEGAYYRRTFHRRMDFKKGKKGDHSGSDRCCSLPVFLYAEKEAITAIKY